MAEKKYLRRLYDNEQVLLYDDPSNPYSYYIATTSEILTKFPEGKQFGAILLNKDGATKLVVDAGIVYIVDTEAIAEERMVKVLEELKKLFQKWEFRTLQTANGEVWDFNYGNFKVQIYKVRLIARGRQKPTGYTFKTGEQYNILLTYSKSAKTRYEDLTRNLNLRS